MSVSVLCSHWKYPVLQGRGNCQQPHCMARGGMRRRSSCVENVIPEANAALVDVEPEAVPAGSHKRCNTQACCKEQQDSKQAGDNLQVQQESAQWGSSSKLSLVPYGEKRSGLVLVSSSHRGSESFSCVRHVSKLSLAVVCSSKRLLTRLPEADSTYLWPAQSSPQLRKNPVTIKGLQRHAA